MGARYGQKLVQVENDCIPMHYGVRVVI